MRGKRWRRGDGFGGGTGQDKHAAMGLVRGRNGRISCRGERRGRRRRWVLRGIVASFGIGGEILVVDVIEIDGSVFVGFCHPPPPIWNFEAVGICGLDQKQGN